MLSKLFSRSSKINEFRTWGLLLTMIGMGTMILGTAGIVFLGGAIGKLIAGIFLVIGMIVLLGSVAIYFWAGMMSTSAVIIQCPECNKPTKMIGKTDRCMFCNTILTYDPRYAPVESDSSDEQQGEAGASAAADGSTGTTVR